MSKLPQISGRDLVKVLNKEGWLEVSQKGSHKKLVKELKPVDKLTIIVPHHKVLKKGTLSRILKDANISIDKLKKLL